jgi:hypothetical protein
MRNLIVSAAILLVVNYSYGQKLNIGIGTSLNHSFQEENSLNNASGIGIYIEPCYQITERLHALYRLETLIKIHGKTQKDSDPPQLFGSNFLLNQYLDFRFLMSRNENKPFVGFSFLGQLDNPYNTEIDSNDTVIRTYRSQRFNLGIGPKVGFSFKKIDAQLSYHFMSVDSRDFVGISITYKLALMQCDQCQL